MLIYTCFIHTTHALAHPCPGQFWNTPISVTEFVVEGYYLIQIQVPDSDPRQFVGQLYSKIWQQEDKPCLYVGDSQGGADISNGGPVDSIIEGHYTDYMTNEPFDVNLKFSQFGSPV